MNFVTFSSVLALSTTLIASNSFAHQDHHQPANTKDTGVAVGGFLDFQAGFRDQDVETMHGSTARDVIFANDTEIHVTATKKTENTYFGAVIELEADVTEDAHDEGLNADKTYLFLENGLGRVELGNNAGAADAMKVDASNFASATGGIHGDWDKYINFPHDHGSAVSGVKDVGGHAHSFIHAPSTPLHNAHGIAEDATKISYYTPRIQGLQFGTSYVPDSSNGGTAAGFTSNADFGNFEDVLDIALNYSQNFQDITLNSAIVGQFGNSEVATLRDIAAYSAGASVSYNNITVGGSYGYWGGSSLLKTDTDDNSAYWTAGAAYDFGNATTSVTYMESNYSGNEHTNLSIGADYQLAPGLTPYVEVNFVTLDHVESTDNEGTIVLAGTQLSF